MTLEEFLKFSNKKTLNVFTDASVKLKGCEYRRFKFIKQPIVACAGITAVSAGHKVYESFRFYSSEVNQVEYYECWAIKNAVEYILDNQAKYSLINIFTDSIISCELISDYAQFSMIKKDDRFTERGLKENFFIEPSNSAPFQDMAKTIGDTITYCIDIPVGIFYTPAHSRKSTNHYWNNGEKFCEFNSKRYPDLEKVQFSIEEIANLIRWNRYVDETARETLCITAAEDDELFEDLINSERDVMVNRNKCRFSPAYYTDILALEQKQ